MQTTGETGEASAKKPLETSLNKKTLDTAADSDSDFDVDTYLRTEATAFHQSKEIERLMHLLEASKNPFEVLEIEPSLWTQPPPTTETLLEWIPPRAIKLAFRKKSLLVHPDKCSLPRAPEAFQLLKKAEGQLTNPVVLEELFHYVKDARYLLQKKSSSRSSLETKEILLQVRRIIKDTESRNRLKIKNVEGRELDVLEKQVKDRKRQIEQEKEWAESREQRIGTWRSFQKAGPKKKKPKRGEDGLL